MPSFDIVVQTDLQEVDNAVNQARKELGQRYDFRGSKSRIEWEKGGGELTLFGEDDYRLGAVLDILQSKLIKRGVSIKNLTLEKAQDAADSMRRQRMTLAQGIDTATCKEIAKRVKQMKLKVQAHIQSDQVRISGKKRDDLQAVMAMVREAELGPEFRFVNRRD
ncbi:MAG: YajQ family cyclic di-GMP-binding protein [Acidobacteria bacterium]|nr:YajQ family cyclic di-GMP-binding protein [Acidobacteriota bacterium]MCZ6725909.1 YajQ family cyclic di-GMP-binding protein [Acidobacteriota bacterium]